MRVHYARMEPANSFRNEGTGMRGISLAKCSAMTIDRSKLNVFIFKTTILVDRSRGMLHHLHHESPTNHLIQSNAHTTTPSLALNMGAASCIKQGVRDRRSEQRLVPKRDFMRNITVICNLEYSNMKIIRDKCRAQ